MICNRKDSRFIIHELRFGHTVSSFPNLCVLHVTRKKAAEVLLNRILDDIKLKKKMNARGLGTEPSTTGILVF